MLGSDDNKRKYTIGKQKEESIDISKDWRSKNREYSPTESTFRRIFEPPNKVETNCKDGDITRINAERSVKLR
jgi:hypothetical protein